MTAMEKTYSTTGQAITSRIPAEELAQLITAPVKDSAGRQLLGIFKDLQKEAADDVQTARLYRRAYLVLENLSFMDAEDYNEDRNQYSTWFHSARKNLMQNLIGKAELIDPKREDEATPQAESATAGW